MDETDVKVVERPSDLDRMNYCYICGSKVIKKSYLASYNSETGEKIYYTKVTCPKSKWYHKHVECIYDENDEYVHMRY